MIPICSIEQISTVNLIIICVIIKFYLLYIPVIIMVLMIKLYGQF